MNRHKITANILSPFLFLLIATADPAGAQETRIKSNRVGFEINNLPDTQPPSLKLITPAIGEGIHYSTGKKELNLIGEVKDESDIKFVSVNSEMQDVNQYGLFSTKLTLNPGENMVKFVAMDVKDNVREHNLAIEYIPPVVTLADRIKRDSKYFALLIGIEEYEDEGIEDLDHPVGDAENFYKSLTRNYAFEPENITFLKNPTRSNIISALDRLRTRITPEDNLLIFYAGHGFWDEEGRIGYWLPSDATMENTVDWFRNSTLVDYLQVIRSRHTLLITDACFAGSIFKARSVKMKVDVAYEKLYDLPSRKAMTSGTLTEVPDESAFIKYLIQRLNENEETYLSSEELFSRIRMAVISNSNVVPRYGEIQNVGNEGGDFIFLKRQ
jgi:hypothetical protein